MVTERLRADVTRYFRHKPLYPGATCALEPIPYIKLPLRNADLSHSQIRPSQPGIGTKIDYSISEGWYYSKNIFGFGHGAVDFKLPYGFPVAAPCEGYAMSSYHSYPLTDNKGDILVRNGIKIGLGIGYFVQIYNPQRDRFIQLGHLSNIADKMPFSVPIRSGNKWLATGHLLNREEMLRGNNQNLIYVKAGETVGFVGYSGLTNEEDYKEGYKRPYLIDPNKVFTWSIPHVHMDEFQRNFQTGKKNWRRDPYDLYSKKGRYPTHTNTLSIGKDPLFLTDENDRPYFADR